MGDTIAINTRILLATKGFHDEMMVHGGSSRARSAQKNKDDKDEGSMVEA
jgi:hypothetical protein